jgi:D-amino-acid dehydrogenase
MSKEILIIGGGVIGLCAAYYSSMRGHRVTVVERGPEDHGGCSFGNAGMIVPSHFIPMAAPGMVALGLKWMWNPESPFYIKPRLDWDLLRWGWNFYRAANEGHVRRCAPLLRDLHLASRACFEELQSGEDGGFGLARRGLLMLCKTARALDEEAKTAALARSLGVPAEVLGAKETAQLDDAIRMDVAGAVYFPKDCHLDPSSFMASLKRRLDAAGARFVWGAEVEGWEVSGNRITSIATRQGVLSADEYIVCGGVWSSGLARKLGLRLPMQAGKGYSLTVPTPRQLPKICSILAEARVAVTPMGGRLRFGGTMEMAGINEEITRRRVQGIIRAVPRYFPDFEPGDFQDLPVWGGLRPCPPDGVPYLGRPARCSNLVVATGHGMMGLSLGPITGKLVSEILSDGKTKMEIGLLRPDRYH